MELSGAVGWYVRHFMNHESVRAKRFRDPGLDQVRAQVASCGGWLVIASRDGTLHHSWKQGEARNGCGLGLETE